MVIDVYAITWLYDPQRHALILHLQDDLRAKTGLQDFVTPLNLVYVARGARRQGISAEVTSSPVNGNLCWCCRLTGHCRGSSVRGAANLAGTFFSTSSPA